MKVNLTSATIGAIKAPAAGQVDYWDERTPGLGLRVSAGGTKAWTLAYYSSGRKHRLILGRWPAMGLADARQAARGYLGDVARGSNPAGDRAAARSESTFGEFAQLYLDRYSRLRKRPLSVRDDLQKLNADLLPAWRDRRLSSIARRDVIAVLDGIVARGAPVHANRVHALISVMFNFAIGRDLVEHNPAYRVPRPAPEKSRDRVLTDDEIPCLCIALDSEPVRVTAVFRLALLTAARRGEVTGMRWSEIDLESGWWSLPAERSKNKLAHRIPLVPSAVAILRALQADGADPEFVFRGRLVRQGAMVNVQAWMKRVRASAQLQDFKMHDIRRTVATKLTELRVQRLVVSKLLNHVETGVTAVYDRHSYDPEKRAALLRWEKRLTEIVTGGQRAAKVVELRRTPQP